MPDDWYLRDVPWLISEIDRLYARIVEKYPERTKEFVTKQRIVTVRKWEPTLHRYEDRFEAAVRQLGCFYIPKIMLPGPRLCSRYGTWTGPIPAHKPSRWRGAPWPGRQGTGI